MLNDEEDDDNDGDDDDSAVTLRQEDERAEWVNVAKEHPPPHFSDILLSTNLVSAA